MKPLAVFALTLFLGLIFNSIFGRYIFRYQIVETFTRAEAKAKLNKRITASCFNNQVRGTVTDYRLNDDGQISVEIKWDKPIAEKFDKLDFGKEIYQLCVIETDTGD